MRQPLEDMGKLAIEMLFAGIEQKRQDSFRSFFHSIQPNPHGARLHRARPLKPTLGANFICGMAGLSAWSYGIPLAAPRPALFQV